MNADSQRTKGGFTLVETVVAVGIVATVMLAMVSLIPLGMGTLKDAAVRAADARIVQSLVSIYQMQDWASVEQQATSGSPREFYFDEKGVAVEKEDPNLLYTARVIIGDPPVVPGDDLTNPYLRKMEIEISDRPINLGDPFEDGYKTTNHSTVIAKIDK